MLLLGNVNVENLLFDSEGITQPISVFFELPKKSRTRRKLKVKYFGFHAGITPDNPDTTTAQFFYDLDDSVKRRYYSWRLPVGEVRLDVLAQGSSISHENVSTHRLSESGTDRNLNSLRFATTKSCDAQENEDALDINDPDKIKENDSSDPSPLLRGHSEMCDITFGFVETNVDQLEARLVVIPDEVDRDADPVAVSGDPNVRMDSISFVLELV